MASVIRLHSGQASPGAASFSGSADRGPAAEIRSSASASRDGSRAVRAPLQYLAATERAQCFGCELPAVQRHVKAWQFVFVAEPHGEIAAILQVIYC